MSEIQKKIIKKERVVEIEAIHMGKCLTVGADNEVHIVITIVSDVLCVEFHHKLLTSLPGFDNLSSGSLVVVAVVMSQSRRIGGHFDAAVWPDPVFLYLRHQHFHSVANELEGGTASTASLEVQLVDVDAEDGLRVLRSKVTFKFSANVAGSYMGSNDAPFSTVAGKEFNCKGFSMHAPMHCDHVINLL